MYKDIEYKLNYHKERIINSFIQRGIFPDSAMIQSQVNSIESRLSIFRNPKFKEGSTFNTAKMNQAIQDIYTDLEILYRLLYEITVKEFNKLNSYIDSHLSELQETADLYLKRAELESYSTALGTSLYFKHNNFSIENSDGSSFVSLGQIDIADATKLACVCNVNNVDFENIVFKFEEKEDSSHSISCNAYNYNHDTVTLPGEKETIEYTINLSEHQMVNGLLELPVVVNEINNSHFVTLAGKDKILYKSADENGEVMDEMPVDVSALSFSGHSYIDFYVVGGSSISFRFSKKPIATNFNTNTNKIENLDHVHHFFIECDEDFSFDFELDNGSVYALREKTLIDNESLYYSGKVDVKDFVLVQTLPGKKRTYDVTANIYNTNVSDDDIKSIMIKKIS